VSPISTPPAPEVKGTEVGTDGDPLAGIDLIVADVARRSQEAAERDVHEVGDRENFLTGFQAACETNVLPAMHAVLDRLKKAGGGGVIEEHRGDEPRFPTPRLTLWMSLEGTIGDSPRPDRHPYLELEADVDHRLVQVSEGDMWRGGGGGRSGRVDALPLCDLTHDHITQELLRIARRSAA
jgi:hypothetical protein